jgi:hypothetical protein
VLAGFADSGCPKLYRALVQDVRVRRSRRLIHIKN